MAFSCSSAVRVLAGLTLLAAAASPSLAQGRFKVSADGKEVLDSSTRLSWKRCVEGMQWDGSTCSGKAARYTYAAAKEQATGSAKGAGAWRVPTRDELAGLVDRNAKKKPRIDAEAFPKTPALPSWASRAGSDDNLNAWLVNFSSGRTTGNAGQKKFPLRLVRDAP